MFANMRGPTWATFSAAASEGKKIEEGTVMWLPEGPESRAAAVATPGQILREPGFDADEPSSGVAPEFKAIPRFGSSMLLRQPKGPAQDTEAEPEWKQVLEPDGIKIENLLAVHSKDDDRILPELRPILRHEQHSVAYEAIVGDLMTGCSRGDIQRVIFELRKWLEITIASHIVSESAHLDSQIDDVRRKLRKSAQRGDKTTNIQEKIDVIEARREEQTQTYMSRRMLCESE
jgi:hypothetical protein